MRAAVHRLDRITSGLLLLSLTRSNASVLGRELQDRVVSKSYVARVGGRFPDGVIVVDDAIQLRGEGEATKRAAAAAAAATAATTVADATAADTSAATVAGESSCAVVAPAPPASPASTSNPQRSIAPANPFMSAHVPARLTAAPSASASAHASTSAASAPSEEAAPQPGSAPAAAAVAEGKSASTEFERLSFDGCTSLVRCQCSQRHTLRRV